MVEEKSAIIKHLHQQTIHNTIAPLFPMSGGIPLHLSELSGKEISNMKDNTITLQGIIFHKDTLKVPNIAYYSSTQYVSNITPSIVKIPTVISDAKLYRKDIQVCNIKHRYLIITIDKIECIKNCSVLDTYFRKN